MISGNQKNDYDARFKLFLSQIIDVSKMAPKEHYLFSLMDSVPFKDLETAILMKHLDYKKTAKARA